MSVHETHARQGNGPDSPKEDPPNHAVMEKYQTERRKCTRNEWKYRQIIPDPKGTFPCPRRSNGMMQGRCSKQKYQRGSVNRKGDNLPGRSLCGCFGNQQDGSQNTQEAGGQMGNRIKDFICRMDASITRSRWNVSKVSQSPKEDFFLF